MSLAAVRLTLVVLVLLAVALAVRFRERTIGKLHEFWNEPSSPLNVALLRILLFAMLFRSARGRGPLWYTGLPSSERDPPWGWRWLGDLPFDEGLVSGAQDALVLSSAAAAVGLWTRATAPVAALLAVYVLGLPNFFAKVNHGGTARVLCVLALAFSPCGDALSLDRLWKWLRGHAPPPPSSAYTIPVRVVWVLIATTYFFPGFWKLWNAGDLWITGEALRRHLYSKWADLPDFEPLFRVDQHAWLLALLGTATLAFEIGFPFALLNRATRTLAALAAAGFHVGIRYVMGITFSPFIPLIVLIEVPERWSLLRRHVPATVLATASALRLRLRAWQQAVRPQREPKPWPSRSVWPALVVGMALVVGQTVAGFAQVNSWPISVFPTFASRGIRPPERGSSLRVTLESEGEEPVDLGKRLKRLGHVRLQQALRGINTKTQKGGEAKHRSRTFVKLLRHAGVHVEPADIVVVYEAKWNVLPPGKRSGFREKVVSRYRVTRGDTLESEPGGG
ncbi:MAG TPA: HTTM domain-containing protein [Polyangiaceae bacterium]